MRWLPILLLSVGLCLAQVPRGKMPIYHANLTKVTAGGGSPPTYLYEQNFDGTGTPASWTAGGADFDNTTSPAPLEGTESMRLVDGDAPYTDNLFDQAEVWAYFVMNPVNFVSTSYIFVLSDTGISECLGVSLVTGTGVFRVASGTGTDDTVTTYTEGQTYHIWVRYKKGTGSDAEGDLWVSTTATKPSNGSDGHASFVNGTRTANARRLYFPTSFSGTDLIYDKCRVDDVEIGSSPP